MSILSVEVSYFQKCFDCPNPTTINLLTFLRSERHREAVERVRAVADKSERDALKKALLPGITPSGVFTHRAESGLIRHSGLIAGDVDMKDNPYTPESLKTFISGFQNVAYCGLSASGQGVWFLVPISNPERHKEHFAALIQQFAKEGIRLDSAPANVASFRFYSYDPDARFNHSAKPYSRLLEARPDAYTPRPAAIAGNDSEKVAAVLAEIESRHMDITGPYETWFSLGCALAGTFGENGRDTFHRISQYSPKYNAKDTDRQFTHCLRMKVNRVTLGTLFEIARRHGIEYKGRLRGYPSLSKGS